MKPTRIPSIACTACGKQGFTSRKNAKNASRVIHPGKQLRAYQCPESEWWHLGHLPVMVVAGRMERAALGAPAQRGIALTQRQRDREAS